MVVWPPPDCAVCPAFWEEPDEEPGEGWPPPWLATNLLIMSDWATMVELSSLMASAIAVFDFVMVSNPEARLMLP